ncbi:MAG: hypothetical protein KDD42_08365 [Bdellovibrionales bacterium]|nr:hypothetical protein [Bdellovibrionales bacterium]
MSFHKTRRIRNPRVIAISPVLRLFCFVGLGLALQACFLAPAIDSFKQAGMTESDRMRMLPKRIERFQDALYWGSREKALAFALPEARDQIAKQLKFSREEERIVDSKVTNLDFEDDATVADAQVIVQYYKVPFYIVTKRIENQKWQFSYADGWLLADRQVREKS